MQNKFGSLVFGICLGFSILILVTSCGQTNESATTTTTSITTTATGTSTTSSSTSSTTLAAATSIRGSLYTGTIRAASALSTSGLRAQADASAPAPNYEIFAVGTVDNKVYFPTGLTSTDGFFILENLPSGESFYLGILNSNSEFAAPISFVATGDSVVMAVTPEAGSGTIDLGQVVLEAGKGAAAPTVETPAVEQDSSSTSRVKSGEELVPVGAGNLGRGTGEALYSGTLKNGIDEDYDGVPDIIDIDDNGNGTVDAMDATPRLPGRVEVNITGVQNTNSFPDLGLQYEDYPTYISGEINSSPINIGTNTVMAIEVVMNGVSPATFSDIKIVSGPPLLLTAQVVGNHTGYENYPNVTTAWALENYKLYKGSDRWSVWVTPYATPEVGDIFKFQLTYAATGTTVEYLSTITYVFTDIPRLISVNSITIEALNLNIYAIENKVPYSGDSLALRWMPPRDDQGNPLVGDKMMHILDGIVYWRTDSPTSESFNGGSLTITPTQETDPIFGPVMAYTFIPTTEAFSYFKIDITERSVVSSSGTTRSFVKFKKL
ncbi:MAG: hypothetical protein QME05_03835 [Candidatus Margulisbacteria bacterium]|nr:hypothetical protein [Candidatus Margulisiibacteriota bacterium]